jgi:hypothetical protein
LLLWVEAAWYWENLEYHWTCSYIRLNLAG